MFISQSQTAKRLGAGSPPQLGLAMLLGFASSSCSFAALSATRSLFTKGAALTSALAFMFASTNLAVEVAALASFSLGWQYALALFVGAPILVTVMAVLVRLTRPQRLVEAAHPHAEQVEGMDMNPSEGLPAALSDRATDPRTWHRVGSSYLAEWRMVWKELLIGFLVAGAVAALVPAAFFQAIFPGGDAWWTLPVQAALAPVLAVLMGNGPSGDPRQSRGGLRRHHDVPLRRLHRPASAEDQRQLLRLKVRRVPRGGLHRRRRDRRNHCSPDLFRARPPARGRQERDRDGDVRHRLHVLAQPGRTRRGRHTPGPGPPQARRLPRDSQHVMRVPARSVG